MCVEGRLPSPGDAIAGKYEVVRVLGRGGMGMVVEARHAKLDQRYAIKILLPEHAKRQDSVARFEREASAVARLTSPHIVRVFDVDVDPATKLPFIVMELLSGHDLATELQTRPVVPPAEAVDWMIEALAGLHDAHALGIVHRDIKPSNLFLAARASAPALMKVMDFGVSKLLHGGDGELTTSNQALGTPSYMAPEQLLDERAVGPRSDLWAVGVVLYRMLSGRLPFSSETQAGLAVAIATLPPASLSRIAPGLPPGLGEIVMQLLERDPARRPTDAAALARMLAPFGSGRVAPASAGPLVSVEDGASALLATASTPTRAVNDRPGRSARWAAAAGVALAGLVAAGIYGLSSSRAAPSAGSAEPSDAPPSAKPPASAPPPEASVELPSRVEPAPPVSPSRSASRLPSSRPPRTVTTRPSTPPARSDEPLHL